MNNKTSRPPLPPLQLLIPFESAARHLNFTLAAEELGTSQPAVSQRVRALENELGLSLFLRLHRGVELTPDGQRLFETVRHGLDALRLATAEARGQKTGRTLTLFTDFGLAKLWLLPRMGALRQAFPDLKLRILTSQDETEPRAGEADLSIVFGDRPETPAELLFAERVVPVCSPALLSQPGTGLSPQQLARLPLLQLQQHSGTARWMDWPQWFRAHGMQPPRASSAIAFNDYSLVVQAAVAGLGVALGWAPLVDELLTSGQLVVAHAQALHTPRGYFLSGPRSQALQAPFAQFRDWILQQSAPGPRGAWWSDGTPATAPVNHAGAQRFRAAAVV